MGMKTGKRFLLGGGVLLVLLLVVWGCWIVEYGGGPVLTGEAARLKRVEILEIAESFAGHEWQASEANILHGKDPRGVWVDTPDVSFNKDGWQADGQVNVGVPYEWGGFSSLEEFDVGIAAGKFGGNIPKGRSAGASGFCVGLDCSGYVSRCWGLRGKQSTRSIGRLCNELDSFDELLPGDIANRYDGHVVIFTEFVDEEHTQMRVYEAAVPKVKESVYEVAMMKERGYVPMRYKKLDER
ncbi:MAG: hypothetical protein GY869_21760 [Planctomycetes bacterium]|nr:hypothetical protein [Planctomycetota bacterium]